ncbi:MAG: hypothetical protein NC048_06735 [Bacteroides sp.]|nr:hypothetical protein [Ruminococcus flavefaciens]MCM1555175.1 hypothetical protein [Bacteroides sp.]
MLRKATLWHGKDKANPFRMMPGFRRYGLAFLFLPLLVSCRKLVPEDISLPYAKKKFTPEMKADSALDARIRVRFDRIDTSAPFLRPFLWLETPCFEEERKLWTEKQHRASDCYLGMLSYRGDGRNASDISWKNRRPVADTSLFHKIIPVCLPLQSDTLPLHLFYRENAFENGQNPTVLMPYDEHLQAYLPPPEAFFETGGILAVLGEPKHVIIRDSSRFFAKCDSLARWIWRDTANASLHRRNYRTFRHDSAMAVRYTKVTEMDVMPDFETAHLIRAANLLVASMYTTPEKMALLAVENGNSTPEKTLFERSDLFRAAVFDIRRDSADMSQDLTELKPLLASAQKKVSVLMNDTESRHTMVAFLQDQMQRKTGAYPCLFVKELSAQDAWRFMLYHIAKEEGVVEVR